MKGLIETIKRSFSHIIPKGHKRAIAFVNSPAGWKEETASRAPPGASGCQWPALGARRSS